MQMSLELSEVRAQADTRSAASAAEIAALRSELAEAQRVARDQAAAVADAQQLIIIAAAAAEEQKEAQKRLEAELAALRADQPPSTAAMSAAVQATYQLQDTLLARERELRGAPARPPARLPACFEGRLGLGWAPARGRLRMRCSQATSLSIFSEPAAPAHRRLCPLCPPAAPNRAQGPAAHRGGACGGRGGGPRRCRGCQRHCGAAAGAALGWARGGWRQAAGRWRQAAGGCLGSRSWHQGATGDARCEPARRTRPPLTTLPLTRCPPTPQELAEQRGVIASLRAELESAARSEEAVTAAAAKANGSAPSPDGRLTAGPQRK